MTATTPPAERPAIVVLGDQHRQAIADELAARYSRDYEIFSPEDVHEAKAALKQWLGDRHRVAMIACEFQAGTHTAIEIFGWLQAVSTTARKVVIVPSGQFRGAMGQLRESQAQGHIDGYFLQPQGVRDEEFHAGITDLLSDWNWTSGSVAIDVARVVKERRTSDVARLCDFLDRMGVPTRTFHADSEVGRELRALAGPDAAYPLVQTLDGRVYSNPSVREMGALLYPPPEGFNPDDVVDLVIVGAGPAGLAAAVYGASEGLKTLVVESDAIGGQAGTSSMIRNYLGFPRGISGMRLAQRARAQASRFGTLFLPGWCVDGLVPGEGASPIHTVQAGDTALKARAVLVATGATYRRLGVQRLEDLVGRGVNYGAATSTAREMQGRDVFVVGGGNSAGQAAVHLARFASSVTVVVRRESLAATMSDYLIRELQGHPRIRLRTCTTVVDGGGEGHLDWLRLRDLTTGDEETVDAGGLYLLLGAHPHCDWLPHSVCRDDHGFVLSGRDVPEALWRGGLPPVSLGTAVPGVFVAGDVRAGSMKRVAAATGEGAAVVALVHEYLADAAL